MKNDFPEKSVELPETDEDTIDGVDEEVEEKVHDIGTKSELTENHNKIFVIYIYIVLVPA